MKRPSYKNAIFWIAHNDEGGPDAHNVEAVERMISVGLVADLFGKSTQEVAADVVLTRPLGGPESGFGQEAHGEICATDPCAHCIARDYKAAARAAETGRAINDRHNADRIDGYDRDNIDSPSGDY